MTSFHRELVLLCVFFAMDRWTKLNKKAHNKKRRLVERIFFRAIQPPKIMTTGTKQVFFLGISHPQKQPAILSLVVDRVFVGDELSYPLIFRDYFINHKDPIINQQGNTGSRFHARSMPIKSLPQSWSLPFSSLLREWEWHYSHWRSYRSTLAKDLSLSFFSTDFVSGCKKVGSDIYIYM